MNNNNFSYPTEEAFNFGGMEKQDYKKAKVVVFPVPYDSTTYYKSGTKFGPQAIIDARNKNGDHNYKRPQVVPKYVYKNIKASMPPDFHTDHLEIYKHRKEGYFMILMSFHESYPAPPEPWHEVERMYALDQRTYRLYMTRNKLIHV